MLSWGEERPSPSMNGLCFTTEAFTDPLLSCTIDLCRLSGLSQIGRPCTVISLKLSGLMCELVLQGSLFTTGMGQAQKGQYYDQFNAVFTAEPS